MVTEGNEIVEAADEESYEDELAEKDRLRGGQANKAGMGDREGSGDESLVPNGGEPEALLSGGVDCIGGLRAKVGGLW